MSYQVPQHIDNNKIFIVNRSEIEGRLDPHFNKPFYAKLWHLLSHQNYKLVKLKDLSIALFSGITPKSGGDAYAATGAVPFVRSGDYSETNEIDFSQLLHIKEEIHQGLMHSSQLKKGDLLIAIVGATIGKIGVFQYDVDANINQAICAVRLKDNISPYYVQAFYQTSIGQNIIERIKRPVARANINIEEIGNLPIPLLDSNTQSEIVRILEEGRIQKKKKDLEAKLLLDSIDTYLLNELGIIMPGIKTDLASRMFLVNRSNLMDRLDPKFNKDFSYIKKLSSIYSWVTLNDIVLNNGQYGANESAIDYKIGDVRYIRITDIDDLGYLKTTDKRTISNIDKAYYLKHNDVLFARSGSVGKCYIHKDTSEQAIFAGYLIRFNLNSDKIDPDYLFYYCNSKLYYLWVNTIQRPAVQANINAQEFRTMRIPLPPLEKQKQIANHILKIRLQAKALQEEGNNFLEQAKKEVEHKIIECR